MIPCTASRKVNDTHHTITFHVDDILSLHADKRVNYELYTWLYLKFGQLKQLKLSRGKVHKFIGRNLGFSGKIKLHVTQNLHVQGMIYACPV